MVKINKNSANYSRPNQLETVPVTNKKKKKLKSETALQQIISQDSKVNVKINKNIDYNEIFKRVSNYQHSSSLIRSGKDWILNLEKESVDNEKPIPLSVRKHLHELAEKIYFDELKFYHQRRMPQTQGCPWFLIFCADCGYCDRPHAKVAPCFLYHKLYPGQDKHSGVDQTMRRNVVVHGTTKDKIAAYVLQCMDTPLFSLKDLNSLIDLVSVKLKVQRIEAIDNILNLFKNTFLPNGFVAKEFECHNFKDLIPFLKSNPEKVQKTLLLWYFEGHVRLAFLKFAENLEKVSLVVQEKTKLQGVKGLQHLALNHGNQDTEVILSMLVNKLGDVNRKIGGHIKNSLSALSASTCSLKVPLVALVEELLYRSNVNLRTQYYCLCFLEDILFDKKELELPERLCILYFDFFKNCSMKGEVNDRFMSAILRGLNRAYLFIKDKKLSFLEEQIDAFYTLTHKTNFNICTQVIQLIYSISGNLNKETSDRFYNILYEKILDNDFGQGSSTSAFLNLVFKAMCKDTNKNRFCAFTRRLLQVIEYKPSQIGCGILFLISEALKDNPNTTSLKSLGKCVFSSQTKELSTQDGNQHEINTGNETFIIEEKRSKLNPLAYSSPKYRNSKFPSAKESRKLELKEESKLPCRQINYVKTSKYLLNNRNPSYCGANLAPIWELSRVSHNYHPSVSLFASNLLSETEIQYSGDPLIDFTLFKSLDRFALKNPKARLPRNDHSKILGNRSYYVPKGARNIPVESDQFKKLSEKKVPAEDMFFYNYFTIYRKQKVKRNNKEDDDVSSSVDDDEFEDYLKRMNEAKSFGFESEDDDETDDLEFDFANKVTDISVDDSDTANDSNSEVDADEFLGSDLDMEEDDVEDLSFSEGSDEEENFNESKKKRSNKDQKDDYGDLLMDADEFSNLLEEAGHADPFSGTSEAVGNKDKSHASQIKWEKKRGKEMTNNKLIHKNSKKPKRLVKPNKTNFTTNKNSKGRKK